jgi:replicative DNA helicase
MTQLIINDTHKQQTDPIKAKSLKDARNNLLELIRSGRLIVKDTAEICTSDQLISEIQNYEHKDKLVVVIDGLYNLLVGENFKGDKRVENIERARVVKYLVDAYRIPLITTGELRKKTKDEKKDKEPVIDDLMETGKFAYNANVVWLLYGKSDDLKTAEPTLTLEYKKNKLSDYKGIQYLTFKRATGTMKELSSFIQIPRPPAGPLFSDGGGHD